MPKALIHEDMQKNCLGTAHHVLCHFAASDGDTVIVLQLPWHEKVFIEDVAERVKVCQMQMAHAQLLQCVWFRWFLLPSVASSLLIKTHYDSSTADDRPAHP